MNKNILLSLMLMVSTVLGLQAAYDPIQLRRETVLAQYDRALKAAEAIPGKNLADEGDRHTLINAINNDKSRVMSVEAKDLTDLEDYAIGYQKMAYTPLLIAQSLAKLNELKSAQEELRTVKLTHEGRSVDTIKKAEADAMAKVEGFMVALRIPRHGVMGWIKDHWKMLTAGAGVAAVGIAAYARSGKKDAPEPLPSGYEESIRSRGGGTHFASLSTAEQAKIIEKLKVSDFVVMHTTARESVEEKMTRHDRERLAAQLTKQDLANEKAKEEVLTYLLTYLTEGDLDKLFATLSDDEFKKLPSAIRKELRQHMSSGYDAKKSAGTVWENFRALGKKQQPNFFKKMKESDKKMLAEAIPSVDELVELGATVALGLLPIMSDKKREQILDKDYQTAVRMLKRKLKGRGNPPVEVGDGFGTADLPAE